MSITHQKIAADNSAAVLTTRSFDKWVCHKTYLTTDNPLYIYMTFQIAKFVTCEVENAADLQINHKNAWDDQNPINKLQECHRQRKL